MFYGALVLMADSLLVLSSILVREGLLSETTAQEYTRILGFYMYASTKNDSQTIEDFRITVETISSHLKGIA